MNQSKCSECGSDFEPLIIPCSNCPRRLCWPCANRSTLRRGAPVGLRDYVIEHTVGFKEFVCNDCQSKDKPEDFVPRSCIGQMFDQNFLTEDILSKHNVAYAAYKTAASENQMSDAGDRSMDNYHETSTVFPPQGNDNDEDPNGSGPPNNDKNELQLQHLQERLTREQQAQEAEEAAVVDGVSAKDGDKNLPVTDRPNVPHQGQTAGNTGLNKAAQPPPAHAGHQNQYKDQGQHQSPMTQESLDAFMRMTEQQFQLQKDRYNEQEERYNKLLHFAMTQANNAASQPQPPAPQHSGSGSTGLVPKFSMPKCTVPEFSGQEPLEYFSWRQRFTLWVKDYDPVYKMACLLPVLKEQALKKVAGLGTTAEAYPLALKVLDDAYGDVSLAIHAAEKKIKDSPAVLDSLKNLEEFVDTNRNAIHFLKQQGQSNDRLSALVPLLVGKLAPHVCEKLLVSMKKREWGSVSVIDLLASLEDVHKLNAAATVYATKDKEDCVTASSDEETDASDEHENHADL